QWEMIYVDHIPRGNLWQTPADWPNVLPGILGQVLGFEDSRFESLSGEWHFEIEPRKGRLHIAIQHGLLGPGKNSEILLVQMTARGPVLDQPGWDFDAGFTVGHEAIIRAFTGMTAPKAHRAWGVETKI